MAVHIVPPNTSAPDRTTPGTVRIDLRWLAGVALLQLAALGAIALAAVWLVGNGRISTAILVGIVVIWSVQIAALSAAAGLRVRRHG